MNIFRQFLLKKLTWEFINTPKQYYFYLPKNPPIHLNQRFPIFFVSRTHLI